MKTKFIYLVFLVVLSSCTIPGYVPYAKDFGNEHQGSYIVLVDTKGYRLKGELIGLDSSQIFVINKKTNQLDSMSIQHVGNYQVYFVQPARYEWVIIPAALIPLFHGYLGPFTLIPNVLITSGVILSSIKSSKYNRLTLPPSELNRYARYPAGIPAEIRRWSLW